VCVCGGGGRYPDPNSKTQIYTPKQQGAERKRNTITLSLSRLRIIRKPSSTDDLSGSKEELSYRSANVHPGGGIINTDVVQQ